VHCLEWFHIHLQWTTCCTNRGRCEKNIGNGGWRARFQSSIASCIFVLDSSISFVMSILGGNLKGLNRYSIQPSHMELRLTSGMTARWCERPTFEYVCQSSICVPSQCSVGKTLTVEDRSEAMAVGEKCVVFFCLQPFHWIKQKNITRPEVIHKGPQMLTFCAVRV
jgi:hypothetical protein